MTEQAKLAKGMACITTLSFNNSIFSAGVAELADALDLGSSGNTRAGSSPVTRT